MNTQMNCGRSLKILMAKHNVEVQTLADHLEITRVYLSGLRSTKFFTGEMIQRISDYFNTNPSEFLKLGEEFSME